MRSPASSLSAIAGGEGRTGSRVTQCTNQPRVGAARRIFKDLVFKDRVFKDRGDAHLDQRNGVVASASLGLRWAKDSEVPPYCEEKKKK